eukprot:1161265-Pelagomonas_calceolata.AAC.17
MYWFHWGKDSNLHGWADSWLFEPMYLLVLQLIDVRSALTACVLYFLLPPPHCHTFSLVLSLPTWFVLLLSCSFATTPPDDLQQLDTRDGRSRLQHGQQARHEVACCESHSKLGGAGKHAAQGVQELRGEGRIDGLHKERERERERERAHHRLKVNQRQYRQLLGYGSGTLAWSTQAPIGLNDNDIPARAFIPS